MSQYQPPGPPHGMPPQQHWGMQPGQPPQKKPFWQRKWVQITGTALLAFTVGAGMAGTETTTTTTTAAGEPQPAPTVTVTAKAKPAPRVTVTAKAKPAPTVTVTAKAEAPPENEGGGSTTFEGDGTFVVGEDIQPGTYRTKGGDLCYWARLKNLSGDFGAIIANNAGDGPQVVTISSSDKGFETNNCGTWSKAG